MSHIPIELRAILLMLLLSSAILLGCANWFLHYTCGNYQDMTGKPTKYVFMDSCYVKTPTGWQRYDEYIARAVTNEGERK